MNDNQEYDELYQAYKQARLQEQQKQLDQMRMSQDGCPLREWAADELVKKFDITPELAAQIVAAEVAEWAAARIPFDWNRPVKNASRAMRTQAIFSTEAQYIKQEGRK